MCDFGSKFVAQTATQTVTTQNPTTSTTTTTTTTPTPIASFDTFLDANPSIEKDLKQNPSLLNDATYLANHPALQSFLAANPNSQQEIAEHPRVLQKTVSSTMK